MKNTKISIVISKSNSIFRVAYLIVVSYIFCYFYISITFKLIIHIYLRINAIEKRFRYQKYLYLSILP